MSNWNAIPPGSLSSVPGLSPLEPGVAEPASSVSSFFQTLCQTNDTGDTDETDDTDDTDDSDVD